MTRSEKTLCAVYAGLALVALVATWSNNLAFMAQPENQHLLSWYEALYANAAAASFTNDLLLFAGAAFIFMALEARDLEIRFVWAFIGLSVVIGVSVFFPLFLIARQIAIARRRAGGGLTAP